MKVTRSSKTTLKFLTESKREQLYEIMDEYSNVVNFFIAMFWGKTFARKDLTKEITGQADTWLSARMLQCAAREALGMVQAAVLSAGELGKEAVKPTHSGKKMILSAQVVRVEKGRNSFDMWLVLSSVGNKIKIMIPLRSHRHMNWFSDWKRSTTLTIHREYVQFSFETETGGKVTVGACVGLDVGINTLLVTSKREFAGPDVKPLINKIKRKAQGSNAYKRAKRELSYYLHKVTKDWFAGHNNLRLVVVEKLKNLKKGKSRNRGKAFRKTLNNWNYRELLDIVQMRCFDPRVSFRTVNPYKTSQTCPSCSHVERGNRSGEKFKCLRCGYSEHADYVGSLNILERFTSGQYGAAFKTLA